MLVLAASNRFRLTPALEAVLAADQTRSATARLRRSLWLEAGAGIAILALVAWFGTLEPPRSEEHTSELQSLMRISYAVFCLKKKKYKNTNIKYVTLSHITNHNLPT